MTLAAAKQQIEIVDFEPRYRDEFARLNYAWIGKLFSVEAIDVEVLENPERSLIAGGGAVLFAKEVSPPEKIYGTVALKRVDATTFELTKMAVDETCRGLGYGKRLLTAAIETARSKGATQLVLYSHTSLRSAIAIYQQAGFGAVPHSGNGGYSRCDIHMRKQL